MRGTVREVCTSFGGTYVGLPPKVTTEPYRYKTNILGTVSLKLHKGKDCFKMYY